MHGIISAHIYIQKIKKICEDEGIRKNVITRFLITNIGNDKIIIEDKQISVTPDELIFTEKELNKSTKIMKTIKTLKPPIINNYQIELIDRNNYRIIIENKLEIEVSVGDSKLSVNEMIELELLYGALDISGLGIAVEKSKYMKLMKKAKLNNWQCHELFASPFNKIMPSYSSLFPYITVEKKLGAHGHANNFINELINGSMKSDGIILAVNPPFDTIIIKEIIELLLKLLKKSEKNFNVELFIVIPIWDIETQKKLYMEEVKKYVKLESGKEQETILNDFYEKNKSKQTKKNKWRFLQLWKNVRDYKDKKNEYDDMINKIKKSKYLVSFNSFIARDYIYRSGNKKMKSISDTHEIVMCNYHE